MLFLAANIPFYCSTTMLAATKFPMRPNFNLEANNNILVCNPSKSSRLPTTNVWTVLSVIYCTYSIKVIKQTTYPNAVSK